jgi:hypothetical protein
MTKTYSVNYWGSNPDSSNDDCHTGFDFETLAEAEACFAAPLPVKNCPLSDVHTFELDGPDVHKERRNPSFRAKSDAAGIAEWERENAMQAGMGGGCDWYNDALGY